MKWFSKLIIIFFKRLWRFLSNKSKQNNKATIVRESTTNSKISSFLSFVICACCFCSLLPLSLSLTIAIQPTSWYNFYFVFLQKWQEIVTYSINAICLNNNFLLLLCLCCYCCCFVFIIFMDYISYETANVEPII